MKESEAVALGEMLEAKGFTDEQIDERLAHSGVKGMKWGQRKAATPQIKSAQKNIKEHSKNARSIIKEHRKAYTPAQKKAAQDRYKKEVLDVMKTPQFRETYRLGNTATRGQLAASMLLSGPYAPLTLAVIRQTESDRNVNASLAAERSVAADILREMRSL